MKHKVTASTHSRALNSLRPTHSASGASDQHDMIMLARALKGYRLDYILDDTELSTEPDSW